MGQAEAVGRAFIINNKSQCPFWWTSGPNKNLSIDTFFVTLQDAENCICLWIILKWILGWTHPWLNTFFKSWLRVIWSCSFKNHRVWSIYSELRWTKTSEMCVIPCWSISGYHTWGAWGRHKFDFCILCMDGNTLLNHK